jgi:hypothetical protein
LINNPSNLTFTIQGTKTSDFDTVWYWRTNIMLL